MWGGIFNLAVEGLGKYTEKASGYFMVLVCGGGILPLLQNWIVDMTNGNYLISYWVIAAGLVYLLYYALIGSKNVNKDIPV
jgi:FHS family L-fucose permease-like MFS transporter